ncbi:MAG: hypothetical protein EXR76_18855 [Myxococcales bacterium]|nr:hypothetical protein [Myxococcales bacterium]
MSKHRRHLSVSTKIALVAAGFVVPVSVLTYKVIDSINEDIEVGRKEVVGTPTSARSRPCFGASLSISWWGRPAASLTAPRAVAPRKRR